MNSEDLRIAALAAERLDVLNRREAFDPINAKSRPTTTQQEVINDFGKIGQQWIRAGNQSGKSQTCARLVSWFVTDSHPSWKKPAEWSTEPLLVIICGATGKHIEHSLLPKLLSYLEPGTYKPVRVGNIIQSLELTNGNRIVFQSLENANEARKRLQSYVAHLVWIDELPPTMAIIRECLIRVQSRNGFLLSSFTPTTVAPEIQHYVDNINPEMGKVYRFHMLDNPVYRNAKRRQQLLDQYAHLPESERKMVFDGDWLSPEGQVYKFDWDTMVSELPDSYSAVNWRHVASVDPATESKLGLTIWAEDPHTRLWYMIRAEYLEKIYVPTEIIAAVEKILAQYRIVRRIADPAATWYIKQASVAPFHKHYQGVYKKNERKLELIKQLQQFLGGRGRICPPCTDFISELQQCRWSDKSDGRIVNASKYHLLDSAQYFCDQPPPPEAHPLVASSVQEALYLANERRIENKEAFKQKLITKFRMRSRRRWSGTP